MNHVAHVILHHGQILAVEVRPAADGWLIRLPKPNNAAPGLSDYETVYNNLQSLSDFLPDPNWSEGGSYWMWLPSKSIRGIRFHFAGEEPDWP